MKKPIAEEGKVELFVYGDSRVNGIIAHHYGSSSLEYEVRGVRCSQKKNLNMWLIDLDLLKLLRSVKPKLEFEIYRRVNGGLANKVDPEYAMRKKEIQDAKSVRKSNEDFPKEEGLTP